MNELLKKAESHHRRGEFEEALQCYLELLKEHPDDSDLMHIIGIVYAQSGKNQDALKYINQAIKINPNHATYQNSKGNLLLRQGKFATAKKYYQKAIQLNPRYPSALNNLGICDYRLEKFEDAEKAYLQAIQLDPGYVDPHYNYALLLIKQGKDSPALQELQKTIALAPHHAQALGQYAEILLRQSEFKPAISYFKARLELQPNHADSWYGLGLAYMHLQQLDEAIQTFEHALENQPHHTSAHHDLANAFLKKGDTENALKHYLQQLEINPLVESYFNIGVLIMNQERHTEAAEYLEHAAKIDPDYLPTFLNLGAIYLKMNKMNEAVRCYQAAIKLKPDDQEIQHILSAITQQHTPDAAPKEYLQHLFDQYAHYYDKHLTQYLQYQVPEKLFQVIQEQTHIDSPEWIILDLGCGTGLSGKPFKKLAKYLIGIDISESMIITAHEKNIYDEIHSGDIQQLIENYHNMDLIIAADVFTYIGDLAGIFAKVHVALKPNGLFIFTVEKTSTEPYLLQQNIRYAHSKRYLETLIQDNHFKMLKFDNLILRKQQNKPVEGYLVLLQKI